MIKENWQKIMKPGRTLPAGVALSHLGDRELSFEHISEQG